MFAEHQPIIARAAQRSPLGLLRVMRFAILSAQVPLARAVEGAVALDKGEAPPSGTLFAWKHEALRLAERDAAAYHWHLRDLLDHTPEPELGTHLLALFTRHHGLGLVKAGFVVQLAAGVSACLDTHNLNRLGLDYRAVRAPNARASAETILNAAWRYQGRVRALGGPAKLWDDWCHYVDAQSQSRSNWASAEEISAAHVRACLADR